MMKPTIGARVNFRISALRVRPGIIVAVLDQSTVDVQFFLDGLNDYDVFSFEECARGLALRTGIRRGPGIFQWEWPPPVYDDRPYEDTEADEMEEPTV